jgi:hypothetical protein
VDPRGNPWRNEGRFLGDGFPDADERKDEEKGSEEIA